MASLAGAVSSATGNNPWDVVAASQPHEESSGGEKDERVNSILDRIKQMTTSPPDLAATPKAASPTPPKPLSAENAFFPQEPESFKDAALAESSVEALILKFLLAYGDVNGRDIAE